MLLEIAICMANQIHLLIDSNSWLVATLLIICSLHLHVPFPILHAPTGHDSLHCLSHACAYRPWFYYHCFLYLFFWQSSYQKLPHFKEFTPAQKYQNDFFCFTNIWPTITLIKLPHFSSNLPLHKNDSFLLSLKCAPLLQM